MLSLFSLPKMAMHKTKISRLHTPEQNFLRTLPSAYLHKGAEVHLWSLRAL